MRIARVTLIVAIAAALHGCGRQTLAPASTSTTDTRLQARTTAEQAVQRRTTEVLAGADPLTELAVGAIQFEVAADVFGTPTPVGNRLFYVAQRHTNAPVDGIFSYTQTVDGESAEFSGVVTCLHLYDFDGGDHNRAKLGGLIQSSNDPTHPAGTYIWWQQIDNAMSPGEQPDKSTLSGFGNEAANDAFCNASTTPRFGPFAVDVGNILVRSAAPGGGRITP